MASSDITMGEIKLCRSDQGDGGWSLHLGNGDEVLVSGEAEWLEDEDRWTRPDSDDYTSALLRAIELGRDKASYRAES